MELLFVKLKAARLGLRLRPLAAIGIALLCLYALFAFSASPGEDGNNALEEMSGKELHYRNHQTFHTTQEPSDCSGGRVIKLLDSFKELRHFTGCGRIFYNRVPKCGSRSMLSTMRILSEQNNFTVHGAHKSHGLNYLKGRAAQDEFMGNFSGFQEPFIFSQHLHYVNFTSLGAPPPVYINVIREPTQRLISHYYYNLYGSGGMPPNNNQASKYNKSLDECIVPDQRHGCISFTNIVVPFFCGNSRDCRRRGPESLAKAKRTIQQSYLVVGVLEDLSSMIEVLEILMPQYFKNGSNIYAAMASEFKNKTATTIKRAILPETAMRVKEMLKWEYDLYDFVKQRFYNLYRKVKVLQSQGPDSDYRVRRKRNSAQQKTWEKALFSGSLKKPKS